MIVEFLPNKETQREELFTVVDFEAKKHFGKQIETKKNEIGKIGIVVKVEIPNQLYFFDVENAKKDLMYKEEEIKYMKDFLSEVLNNLSFVPEVNAE